MSLHYIALSDVELIEKVLQAERTGEINFTDAEGQVVRICVPQVGNEHITGDFGEREIF